MEFEDYDIVFDDDDSPEHLFQESSSAFDDEFSSAVEHMYKPKESIFGAVAHQMVEAGWSIYPQEVDGLRRPGTVNKEMIKWSEKYQLATKLPDKETLDLWAAQCASLNVAVVLGPASGNTLVIDVDVVEEELSAQIQEQAEIILGYTPLRRVGNWPKMALVYRHDPIDEIPGRSPKFAPFETPDNPENIDQGLEIISAGQTMTFYGKHHRTGRYFRWLEGPPQLHGPQSAPVVTPTQINDFLDAVDGIRQFHKSAAFDGSVPTWEWDEDAQINVPKMRSSGGATDWQEDETGKVFDGREAYLTKLAFRIVTANPGTASTPDGRETLTKIVAQQFTETAVTSGRWRGNNLYRETKSKVNRTAEKMRAGVIKPFVPAKTNDGEYIVAASARSYIPAQPRDPAGDSLDFMPPFSDPTAPGFIPNQTGQRKPMRAEVISPEANAFEDRKIEEDRTRIAKSVQEGLNKAFITFWDEVYDTTRTDSRIHILKAPTGAGKTSRGIQFVAEDVRTKDDYTINGADGQVAHQGRSPILFLLPTYDNIDELRSRSKVLNLDPTLSDADLRKQAESLQLIQVDELDGKLAELRRDAKNAGLVTMLYQGKLRAKCQRPNEMKIAMEAGMSTSRLCEAEVPSKDKDENGKVIMEKIRCRFYEDCEAMQQKHEIERSHVVFLPHAFLALSIPDELKNVRAVVADERIHHLFLHTATLDLDIFTSPRKPPKLTKKEKAAGVDSTEFNPLRLKAAKVVVEALMTNKCPAEALVLDPTQSNIKAPHGQDNFFDAKATCEWISAALRTCGASMQRDGDITPEIDIEDLIAICSQPTGVQVREEYRFWKIIEERYKARRAELHIIKHGGSPEKILPQKSKGERDYRIQYVEDLREDGEPYPKIRISWRETPNWLDRPLLLLDASAAPEMISKIWSGKDVVTHDIQAALNVRTVCIADRTYSNSSVIAPPTASALEKLSSAKLLGKIRTAISTVSSLYGYSRVVAGGSILVRRAVNTAWEGPHNVDWCHFGAMRGLDFAKYHAAAISVGRMELPVRTLDGLVAALTYDDDEPEKPFDILGTGLAKDGLPLRIPTVIQRTKMRSGHDINMPVPMFPGKWGRMIQRQYREEELLQFLGRLRPVYREGQAPIWFSLSSVIPEEVIVDDIINLEDLVDNRSVLWEAMRRCHGILDSRIAAQVCSELFDNQKRVVFFMNRAGINEKNGDINKRIGWALAAFKWETTEGEIGHSFVRAEISDKESALRNALQDNLGLSIKSLVQISETKPQTLARGRKVDKIEDELGTLEARKLDQKKNALESAVALLMSTPPESIEHLLLDNNKIRLPLHVPSGIHFEDDKSGNKESRLSVTEAETRLSIKKLWEGLGYKVSDGLDIDDIVIADQEDNQSQKMVTKTENKILEGSTDFDLMVFDRDDMEIPF